MATRERGPRENRLTSPQPATILLGMGELWRYSYAGAYHHVSLPCINRESQFADHVSFWRQFPFDTNRANTFDECQAPWCMVPC